ncbi:hypothetical protein PS834_04004 [Pseudomonas fluorescens]|nr:hypothetical protein PS834_04004 [Pseudomonas fluorescens]
MSKPLLNIGMDSNRSQFMARQRGCGVYRC